MDVLVGDSLNDAAACARIGLDINGLEWLFEVDVFESDVSDAGRVIMRHNCSDRHSDTVDHLAVLN